MSREHAAEAQAVAELRHRAALGRERRYLEEAADIEAALAHWTDRTRGGFERGLGIWRAKLVVREPVAPELAHGLFAAPAAHPSVVRFSSFAEGSNLRGMEIKVLREDSGVAVVTMQDLLLVSSEQCPFASVRDYTPAALAALPSDHLADPAETRFHGLFPLRLGPHRAMKLTARPRPRSKGAPAVFDVAIQLQEDPEREPVEDASIPWNTASIDVAELQLEDRETIDDERFFASPFQCLPDHDPLGRINRLRRHLYEDPTPHLRAFTFAPSRQRVCVVGAGAAGMATADGLSQRGHDVVLVERRDVPGGHAESVAHGALETDPSFGSYTRVTHPNLFALLERLGLESFELTTFNEGGSWRTADGRHLWTNTQDLPFGRHVFDEILRFNRQDIPLVRAERSFDEITAGDFLRTRGYSRDFVLYYFFGHVVYGFPGHAYSHYLQYPIRPLLNYLFDFTVHGAQALYSVTGGSGRYARRYAEALVETGRVDLRLGARLSVLARDDRGVTVRIGDAEERFDHLVISAQPHHALSALGEAATSEERVVLSRFGYTTDTVYLHTDPAHMPSDRSQWRYLNMLVPDPSEQATATHFVATKLMPSNHDGETPVFMTFAHRPDFTPPSGATAVTREHPRLDVEAIDLRRLLDTVQGANRTWYCGAYTRGLALHDDALVSGFVAANRILGAGRAVPIIERPALLESEAAAEATGAGEDSRSPAIASNDALLSELEQRLAALAPPERDRARTALNELAMLLSPSDLSGEESVVSEILRVIQAVTRIELNADDVLLEKLAVDSLGVIELAEALRRALNVTLPPTVFQPGLTPAVLARHVLDDHERRAPRQARGLEPLAAPPQETALFLAPPLLLDADVFTTLARVLGRDRAVYGLPAASIHVDTEALVREHVDRIVATCPERQCFLGGYSHGGGVAHRLAELLTFEHGFTCPVVFMLDSFHAKGFGADEIPAEALGLEHMVALYLRSVASSLPPGWEEADPDQRLSLATDAYERYGRRYPGAPELLEFLELRRQLLASQEKLQAEEEELSSVLPELVYFRAGVRDPSGRHAELWGERFLYSTVHDVPADHGTMLRHVELVSKVMGEIMRQTSDSAFAVLGHLPNEASPTSFFDLSASTLAGETRHFTEYEGKVVLVVNVASRCTFTPQYTGLEQLYADYGDRGFVVLGFPSNEFGGQEPGDAEAIQSFCATSYGVTFPMFDKVETLGTRQSDVFRFLTRAVPPPQWNFTKYLVGRDGHVLASFTSSELPDDPELRGAIEAALGTTGT